MKYVDCVGEKETPNSACAGRQRQKGNRLDLRDQLILWIGEKSELSRMCKMHASDQNEKGGGRHWGCAHDKNKPLSASKGEKTVSGKRDEKEGAMFIYRYQNRGWGGKKGKKSKRTPATRTGLLSAS